MATFQKRSTNWRAIVRLMGIASSATFSTKAEAQAWAIKEEAAILAGKRGDIPEKTFGQLLERYADEVSVTKKGERWERFRIELTCRDAISKVQLKDLDTRAIAAWRDRRLTQRYQQLALGGSGTS